MYKLSGTDQRGIAHIILMLLFVVVIGVIGFAGWRVMDKNKTPSSGIVGKVASVAANKECVKELNDKDICKFLNSWNVNQKFKLVSTTTSDGSTSKTEMSIDGDKTHMKMDGELAMEVISIGDTTYTKAGDTWWKQVTKQDEPSKSVVDKDSFKFEEPKEDSPSKNLTKYELVGKEACGNLTCFKYKVVDPGNNETTEHIWFDNKDYLMRRGLSEGIDGTKSDSLFSYDGISVKAPSPVRELGPNQYIMPGETEPQTMPSQPSEAEMQDLIKQYSQQ